VIHGDVGSGFQVDPGHVLVEGVAVPIVLVVAFRFKL
jgi:preprotein translocase subunit Sec61beta